MQRSIFTLTLFVLVTVCASAQQWNARTSFPGAAMDDHVWVLGSGDPVIALVNGPSSNGSTVMSYLVRSLSPDSDPYGSFSIIKRTSAVGDLDGDSRMEFIGESDSTTGALIVSGPYSEDQAVQPYNSAKRSAGSFWDRNALVDCDGDGINDVFSYRGGEDHFTVSYGDSNLDSIWIRRSVVLQRRNLTQFDSSSTDFVCAGVISKIPHVLQAVTKESRFGPDSTFYVLSRLNRNDLGMRKDTIDAVETAVFFSRVGHAYVDFIIEFSDSWQIPRTDAAPYSLRVTESNIELIDIEDGFSNRLGGRITAKNCLGASGAIGSFRRFDGEKPFMVYSFSRDRSELLQWIEVRQIDNTQTLDTRLIAVAQLTSGFTSDERENGGLNRSILVDDVDGDSSPEVLAYYQAVDENNAEESYVDLFMSTDRPPVSVEETPIPEQPQPCTFTNAPAFVYNVLGEVVASVDIVEDQIAPHHLEALPQQPLWIVQGECVRPVPGTR